VLRYDIKYTVNSLDDAGKYGCSTIAYGNVVHALKGLLDVYSKFQ
jgi:hypothetical protein